MRNNRVFTALTAALSIGLGAAVLSIAPSAQTSGPAFAQAPATPNLRISQERKEFCRKVQPDITERVMMGARVVVEDAEYTRAAGAPGEINLTARINFQDSKGYIDGIKAKLMVMYRAGNEQDARVAYREIPSMAKEAATDSEGRLRFRVATPTEKGLIPGQYYLKLQMFAGGQTEKVKGRMRNDPSLWYRPAFMIKDEKSGDPKAMRAVTDQEFPKECDRLFAQILANENPIPSTQFKLYVSPDSFWMDDGSIEEVNLISALDAAVNKAKTRITTLKQKKAEIIRAKGDPNKQWPVPDSPEDKAAKEKEAKEKEAKEKEAKEKGEKDKSGVKKKDKPDPNARSIGGSNKPINEQITFAEEALARANENLQFYGGSLTKEEHDIQKRAKDQQAKMRRETYALDDELIRQYYCLYSGDMKYWQWKAWFYGESVFNTLQTGKYPWELVPIKVNNVAVTTAAQWKQFTKNELTLRVNGDSKTWKENQKEAKPGDPPPPAENRGGEYPSLLLPRMLKDIDDFDFDKFIEPQKDGAGKITGYQFKRDKDTSQPEAWMAFERQFIADIAYNEEPTDELKPVEFSAFTAQNTEILKGEGAPKTTGGRVRNLDLGRHFGYASNRFPESYNALSQAFKALAYLPMAYRYSIYTEIEKMDKGKELDSLLGTDKDFPAIARVRATDLKASHVKGLAALAADMKAFPGFGAITTIMGYTEGKFRSIPAEQKKPILDKAKKDLEIRYVDKTLTGDASESGIITNEDSTPGGGTPGAG